MFPGGQPLARGFPAQPCPRVGVHRHVSSRSLPNLVHIGISDGVGAVDLRRRLGAQLAQQAQQRAPLEQQGRQVRPRAQQLPY